MKLGRWERFAILFILIIGGIALWSEPDARPRRTSAEFDFAYIDVIRAYDSGVLTIQGYGGTNNESLTIDTETTANKIIFGTGSGVLSADWGTIGIESDSLDLSEGDASNIGDIALDSLSPDGSTITIDIAAATDFTFAANLFTAAVGSTLATDTIAETTGANGVVIDSLTIKDAGLTATGAVDVGSGTLEFPNGTDLPATCNVGEIWVDTDDDACADAGSGGGAVCVCKAADTWALVIDIP